MPPRKPANDSDPEIQAISAVYAALKDLEPAAQQRVLRYVAGKLELTSISEDDQTRKLADQEDAAPPVSRQDGSTQVQTDLDGISPVATKWIKRSGLDQSVLSQLFSLGMDDIDLVAKSVPGNSKTQRMRSVLLLKGIASYLSTGVARVTHEQLKEACLHYDAFDSANFAAHLKSFSAEVTGTKETGYTLTPRGITAATELIKGIANSNKKL